MLMRRFNVPLVLVLLALSVMTGTQFAPSALAKVERDGGRGTPKHVDLSPAVVPSAPLGDFVLDTVQRYYGNSDWSPNRQSGKRAKLSSVALMSQGTRWIRAKAYVLKWKQAEKDWILNHYSNNTLRVEIIYHAFRQDTSFCIGVTTDSSYLQSNLPGAVLFLKSSCEPRAAVTDPAGIDVAVKYDFSAWFLDNSPRELGEIPLAFGWQTLAHHDAAPDDNVKKFCFGADEGRSWAPNVLSIGTCRDGAPVLLNNSTYFLGTVTEGFTGQDNYLPDNEVGNDSVKSLKVNEGWQVTLFENMNYAGVSETFTAWDPDLSNNAIGYGASSVQAIANGVTVHEHNDFNGISEVFGDGCDADLSDNAIGNNRITSVRVPPGWRLTLYDSTGCSGAKYVIQGIDDPYVNYGGFNDRASSLKVDSPQTQLNNGEIGDWVPD